MAIGYPESAADGRVYNALVFVNSSGSIVAHYRKSYLYYTDETWACEGQGFYAGHIPLGQTGKTVTVAAGICMDINPYKFEAPWTLFEFANHAREMQAKLVVVSMAWLTRLTGEDCERAPGQPDLQTVGYWVERFVPLLESSGQGEEVVIAMANRTGAEGVADRIGEVRYAGSSCVMGMTRGRGDLDGHMRIWDMLGRAEEGVLVVDTQEEAKYRLGSRMRQEESETTVSADDSQ